MYFSNAAERLSDIRRSKGSVGRLQTEDWLGGLLDIRMAHHDNAAEHS